MTEPSALPEEQPEIADATANELIAELPEEVLAFLVRAVPNRDAWTWLGKDENYGLLSGVTRGFQRNPQALRQPVVRTRLTRHFAQHPEITQQWLLLWAGSKPRVLEEVRELAEDEALHTQLATLWHRHGAEALILSLVLEGRRAALDALDNVAEVEVSEEEPSTEEVADAPDETTEAIAPDLHAEIERLQTQRDEWRARSEALQNQNTQLQSTLSAAQEKQKLQTREMTAGAKREKLRADNAEAKLHETEKLFDRTARRLRSLEKEHEETAHENKRLKRQYRRGQEINEELRKQIAQLLSKLENLTEKYEPKLPVAPEPEPKAAPKPHSPLDQMFIWKSDGRQFHVTPREVQRAIDSNDEAWVFRLIQALDALQETNAPGYRVFMNALQTLDPYYRRVLTSDTTRVLVDASNVARYEKTKHGKGQLKHLLGMRRELRLRGCFPIQMIADASLPYNIDDVHELLAMGKRGEIEFSNAGQEADEVLAREARRTGAYVVTNDRNFYLKVTPDFEPPRITFRIHDGFLVVDEF
jgi:hypothetical protein